MNFYIFFHLNLNFSSLEKKFFKTVIHNCYHPILSLAEELNISIGLEASGYTLEIIKEKDSEFIKKLNEMISKKKIYFIGSGYSQIISPLIPSVVNQKNLEIGKITYKKILKKYPKVYLVNEQAMSKGLISNYTKFGIKDIIIEQNNFKLEKNLNSIEKIQKIKNDQGKSVNVIWNNSTSFQNFQKYIHGLIPLAEYMNFLNTQKGKKYIPIYANDAEIFDFRPGRFKEEAKLPSSSEWKKIYELLKKIKEKGKFINLENYRDKSKLTFNPKDLENAVLVKKQLKYNLSRWSVTGISDITINTKCYRIFESLDKKKNISLSKWKKLCHLWSSDFRTHINLSRWKDFNKELNFFYKNNVFEKSKKKLPALMLSQDLQTVKEDRDRIEVSNKNFKINFNKYRGLTIENFFLKKKNILIIKNIKQGFYKSSKLNVDWYSGFFLLHSKKYGKITDLRKIKKYRIKKHINNEVIINFKENFFGYDINKTWVIGLKSVKLYYDIKTKIKNDILILRNNFFNINPDLIKKNIISLSFYNGGSKEKFSLDKRKSFDHGAPINLNLSSHGGVGNTENQLDILKNNSKLLSFENIRSLAYPLTMFTYVRDKDDYFFRVFNSYKEVDDTSKNFNLNNLQTGIIISV